MFEDDDDDDLTNADRGDTLPEDKKPDPAKADEVVVDEVKVEDVKVEVEDPAADKGDDEDADDGRKRGPDGKFVAKDKAKDADADADDDDGQNFPIRLNRAKAQRDTYTSELEKAQARLAELERQVAAPREPAKAKTDPIAEISAGLDELYEQVEELRADGKSKDAARVQREIDAKNRQIAQIEAERMAARVSTQAQLDAQYDAMVDVIEQAFPELVKGNEEHDPDQVKEFNLLVTAYEKAGMTGPAALRKAVKVLYRTDPFAPASKAEKTEEKPAAKEAPKAKGTDVKKAIDTQKRQPPDTSARGVNKDDTKINVDALDDDEFDALPESKKRELRGDFV
jgi:hypothetical protein